MLLTPEKGPVCVLLDLTHTLKNAPFCEDCLLVGGGGGHTDDRFVDNLLVLGN